MTNKQKQVLLRLILSAVLIVAVQLSPPPAGSALHCA